MARALYPKFKELCLGAGAGANLASATVKVALVDTGVYSYSTSDQYYANVTGVVGTPQEITGKSVTDGVFNGANVSFSSVIGNTTSPLVDTATGLPVTPNGGDIDVAWDTGSSKIFAL